ncbi:MAG: DUF488 domain-containing protein [Gammaproteobacteria bacterium]
MSYRLKRVYDDVSPDDGYRVLVDGVWPRGVSKQAAALDAWMKDIAPSGELRKWFGHRAERWPEFKRRYFHELRYKEEPVRALRRRARGNRVTLVYGARDTEHNNAVVLAEYLRGQ